MSNEHQGSLNRSRTFSSSTHLKKARIRSVEFRITTAVLKEKFGQLKEEKQQDRTSSANARQMRYTFNRMKKPLSSSMDGKILLEYLEEVPKSENQMKLDNLSKYTRICIKPGQLRQRADFVNDLLKRNIGEGKKKLGAIRNISNIKHENKVLELDKDLSFVTDDVFKITISVEEALSCLVAEEFPLIEPQYFDKNQSISIGDKEMEKLFVKYGINLKNELSKFDFTEISDLLNKKKSIPRKRLDISALLTWFSQTISNVVENDTTNKKFTDKFSKIAAILGFSFKELIRLNNQYSQEQGLLLNYLYSTIITLFNQYAVFTKRLISEKLRQTHGQFDKERRKLELNIDVLVQERENFNKKTLLYEEDLKRFRDRLNVLNEEHAKLKKVHMLNQERIKILENVRDDYNNEKGAYSTMAYKLIKIREIDIDHESKEEKEALQKALNNILDELLATHDYSRKREKERYKNEKATEILPPRTTFGAVGRFEAQELGLKYIAFEDQTTQTEISSIKVDKGISVVYIGKPVEHPPRRSKLIKSLSLIPPNH